MTRSSDCDAVCAIYDPLHGAGGASLDADRNVTSSRERMSMFFRPRGHNAAGRYLHVRPSVVVHISHADFLRFSRGTATLLTSSPGHRGRTEEGASSLSLELRHPHFLILDANAEISANHSPGRKKPPPQSSPGDRGRKVRAADLIRTLGYLNIRPWKPNEK